MALSPHLVVTLEELALDGVGPDDPLVAESLERALGPALAAHGPTGDIGQMTAAAVVAALGEEDR
jgi:hypothetical protein